MIKNKHYLIGGLILSIIIIIMFVTHQKTPEVETTVAKKGNITIEIKDSGTVEALLESNVYSPQNGTIHDLLVKIGQKVDKNQILIQIKNPELDMKLSEAKINLAQTQANLTFAENAVKQTELELDTAKANLERTSMLFRESAVSKVKLEEAESQVKNLEIALQKNISYRDSLARQINEIEKIIAQLEEQREKLTIRSPIKGTIVQLPVKKRQPVTAGTLLTVVADMNSLQIKADILSENLSEIKVGQKAVITSPVLGNKHLEGKVAKIYPRAEEKKSALGILQYRVPVIISISKNSLLKPGYEVDIAITIKEHKNVLIVPREAVRTTANSPIVMKIVNGKIKYQPIQTGLSDDENIEIKRGLKEGDLIIKNGSLELKENTRVNPVR
ncbi:efflux RND transporter periplasmic adaptor subunit [Thermosyntropha sp.]|uniref:efflux RND transporter periplasmic adaptor subunit n=1 Tax=Thermosyntropha sp. TaxID=2740820 RepID=UPI0025F46603|nr:efflux RND transporter periplasmic adaptor subunit [Thermosyntropha sp.]MBO8158282.1 efflux RND transporter periplasmic adaptor subunit [Thermosyntropha sp.]